MSKARTKKSRPVALDPACSFCGDLLSTCDVLIESDDANICDVCVGVCVLTLEKAGRFVQPREAAELDG